LRSTPFPATMKMSSFQSRQTGGNMATAQRPAAIYPTGSNRNLNNVQRVQRSMIWVGLFVLLGALTVVVSLILMAVSQPLGAIALLGHPLPALQRVRRRPDRHPRPDPRHHRGADPDGGQRPRGL